MNAFQAIAPVLDAASAPSYEVNLYLDPDGDIWLAESDALPIATEAPTLDALVARVWAVAPEIAAANGHRGILRLRFILETATPA
jgi:hypothetical protein